MNSRRIAESLRVIARECSNIADELEPRTPVELHELGDDVRRADQRARAEKRTADARSLEQLRREAEEKRTHPKLVVDPEWAFRQSAAKRPPATVTEAK